MKYIYKIFKFMVFSKEKCEDIEKQDDIPMNPMDHRDHIIATPIASPVNNQQGKNGYNYPKWGGNSIDFTDFIEFENPRLIIDEPKFN
jgi:hypothetical protein